MRKDGPSERFLNSVLTDELRTNIRVCGVAIIGRYFAFIVLLYPWLTITLTWTWPWWGLIHPTLTLPSDEAGFWENVCKNVITRSRQSDLCARDQLALASAFSLFPSVCLLPQR